MKLNESRRKKKSKITKLKRASFSEKKKLVRYQRGNLGCRRWGSFKGIGGGAGKDVGGTRDSENKKPRKNPPTTDWPRVRQNREKKRSNRKKEEVLASNGKKRGFTPRIRVGGGQNSGHVRANQTGMRLGCYLETTRRKKEKRKKVGDPPNVKRG